MRQAAGRGFAAGSRRRTPASEDGSRARFSLSVFFTIGKRLDWVAAESTEEIKLKQLVTTIDFGWLAYCFANKHNNSMKNHNMLSLRKVLLSAGLLSCVTLAQAAPITLNADHFSITYDDAVVGLYKQGLLSGSLDTVYFLPNTFSALSGGSLASTTAPLQLTLTVDPGYTFSGLTYTARGDYFLFGGGAVDVASSVQAANATTAASTLLNLAPGLPLAQSGSSTPWELTGDLSLGGLGTPQTLVITLDNALFASASTGGLGFIQETYAGIRVATQAVPVPEPTSLALLLAGAIAASLVGRRRKGVHSGARALGADV